MSSTEEIKERLPIADVVSLYIKLERAGQNFKTRCPFHNEKTPSFIVSPSRNTYHCFGCNVGGDIFSFVEEIEGVDFKRALEILADRAGVVLERVDPKLKNAESRVYGILEEATKFYENGLKRNKDATDYLKERGLTVESIEKWRLGYADNEWRALLVHLKEKKYTEIEIERAGLVIKGEKGYYDRFRGRIIFPVGNVQGKIAGFSGRHFIKKGDTETDTAKYINSPETALYNKSRVLYGFDKAKRSIMKEDMAVLVEGQMDLVMSHQVGIINTVATSGTALTEEHLKMIKRFTDKIVMAFDGDEAGFSASERGFNLALSLGLDVRIAKLPLNVDPADMALKSPDVLISAIKKAKHIINFYLDSLIERGLEARELKTEASKRVLPYIATIQNRIDQAHFVGQVAKVLGINEEPIWEEVKKIELKAFESQKEEKEGNAPITKEKKIYGKIVGIILWQEEKRNKERIIDIQKEKERLKMLMGEVVLDAKEKKDLALQAEVHYEGSKNLIHELEGLFLSLEQGVLEEDLRKTMAEHRLAENKKDEEKAKISFENFHQISKKINEIKNKIKSN